MEDAPSKPSVAELAGRLKGHILPMPSSKDELRRRPPCSLQLQHKKHDDEHTDKNAVSPNPFKVKMRNSPIIEKLQANLALSPTALLPSPKNPEVKLQAAPQSPAAPRSPVSPASPTLEPSHLSTEDEDPVSFDSPAEGAQLHSINKTRARLSFKRRPPTRQHRRSAGEEAGAFGSTVSTCELYSPNENGNQHQVFSCPAEEEEYRELGSVTDGEDKDRDCEMAEDNVEDSDPDDKRDPQEEQTPERAPVLEAVDEERQPSEQTEGDVTTEEETARKENNV